jgi:serine/threonine-protein kinase
MAVGRVLAGRYRLEARLGGGGMSIVWRAYDEVLRRRVAVKVVAPRRGNEVLARDRIRTEARAAMRLNHPHIAKVLDYSYSAGTPYVVMELLDGPTLAERMRVGRLPVPTVLEICAQVADALAAAHACGVVHRDIKPGNVILAPAGAMVMDFGIAAFVEEADESGQPAEMDEPAAGSIWGTAAYVAPERLTSNRVLPASDVYALGVLLYRALTGQRPWPAVGRAEMLAAHVSTDPALLPADADVPPEVAALCVRCLAKDPRERPAAREAATVLATAAAAVAAAKAAAATRAAAAAAAARTAKPAGGAARAARAAAGAARAVSRRRFRRRHAATPPTGRLRRRPVVVAGSAGLLVATVTLLSFCALTNESGVQIGPEAAPPRVQPSTSVPGTSGPSTSDPSSSGPGESPPDASRPPDQADSGAPATGSNVPAMSSPDLLDMPGQPGGPPGSGSMPAGGGPTAGDGQSAGDGTPGPTPTPGGTPAPTPPPTAGREPPNPGDPVELTLSTLAGTVVARCEGPTPSLVSWDPLPGYSVTEVTQGPGAKVTIVFSDVVEEVTLTVHCKAGVPTSMGNSKEKV